MKTRLIRSTLIAASFVLLGGSLFAQDFNDPRFANYGNTAEERKANIEKYNMFNDAVKLNDMPRALSYLNELLTTAPKASENLYIRGAMLYKKKISSEKDPEARNAYKDSLLRLYDLRLENFSDHPKRGKVYIKEGKAKEALQYLADDTEKLIPIVDEALKEAGPKADPGIIQNYFNILSEGYANDAVETSVLLNQYDFLSDLIAKSEDPNKEQSQEIIDKLFLRSGAANCENLEKLFKPQYEANPDNEELITKILRYFAKNDCNSDFSALIAEKYYAIKPTANAAIAIAGSYTNKKEFDKAFEYYDQAINMEESVMNQSLYATRAAATALLAGNPRKTADYARKAINLNGKNGNAYFLLAQAYAQGSGGCEGFMQQTLFWLIVDNLVKAKSLLADQPEQIELIDKLIPSYTSHFPSNEDIFMETLKPGDSYTVNCGWITGTTTVRERR